MKKAVLVLAMLLMCTSSLWAQAQGIRLGGGWGVAYDAKAEAYITYTLAAELDREAWFLSLDARYVQGPTDKNEYYIQRPYPGQPKPTCRDRETQEEVSWGLCNDEHETGWLYTLTFTKHVGSVAWFGTGASWNSITHTWRPIGRIGLRNYAYDGAVAIEFNLDVSLGAPWYFGAGYTFVFRVAGL